MAYVRGETTAMRANANQFGVTGQDAVATGQQATDFAATMQMGVEDASQRLETQFQSIADELRSKVDGVMAEFASLDWEGQARANVESAAEQLRGNIDQVLEQSLETTRSFRQMLSAQADEYFSGVQGQFQSVMGQAQEFAEQIRTAEESVAQGLEDVDSSVTLG